MPGWRNNSVQFSSLLFKCNWLQFMDKKLLKLASQTARAEQKCGFILERNPDLRSADSILD